MVMDKFLALLLEAAPKSELSRLSGFYAERVLRGALGQAAIRSFVKLYDIDIEEIEKPLSEYRSLAEFFSRGLKPHARLIDSDPKTVVSPADALVSQCGDLCDLTLVQAKGKYYQAEHLLQDSEYARVFKGGKYIVLYLSPRDYHRTHSPLDAEIYAMRYIPGRLFAVNKFGVNNIQSLFTINERLATYLDTKAGRVAYIMVGAMNVGKIKVVFSDFATNKRNIKPFFREFQNRYRLKKGDEFGRFELGSTVILLFEKGGIEFFDGLEPGARLKVGEAFAKITRGV
ncbi:MAG: hypothetical protein Kow0090_07230 [Myxococcota bacterium]